MFNDEMVTESLIRYIQIIQRERRTGLLIVKRGREHVQEEGRVRFTQGHVSETKLGRRTGAEAFNELCTWSNCRVSFVSNDGREIRLPPSSASPPAPPSSDQARAYMPGSSPIRQRSSTSADSTNARNSSEQDRSFHPPLGAKPVQTRQFNAGLQVIEQMQLSRSHRQVFLLINGQRTLEELIHLSSRSQEEVLRILQDLQRAAVIRI